MIYPSQNDTVHCWRPPAYSGDQSGSFSEVKLGRILDDGGTANIHVVEPHPQSRRLIKIFTHEFNSEERQGILMKYKRMAQNRLVLEQKLGCAVFPDRLVFRSPKPEISEFVGCRMRLVDNAISSAAFARHHLDLASEGLFPGATEDTLRTVALNIVTGMQAMHEHGIFLGDPNANNILIDKQSLKVSFIDPDSFVTGIKVKGPGGIPVIRSFPPAGTTPGFRSVRIIKESRMGKQLTLYGSPDDNYVLAIHIFRFLVPGFHPFNLSTADATECETRMLKGDFPYAATSNMAPCLQSDMYKALPGTIRAAFHDVFVRQQPLTPSQWRALFRAQWGHLRCS